MAYFIAYGFINAIQTLRFGQLSPMDHTSEENLEVLDEKM